MAAQGKVYVRRIFSNVSVTTAAGATTSTAKFTLDDYQSKGFFSVLSVFASAGAGTIKLEYSVSFDGTNFYIPEDESGTVVTEIVTAQAKATTNVYAMTPVIAPFYKLVVTASTANITGLYVDVASG